MVVYSPDLSRSQVGELPNSHSLGHQTGHGTLAGDIISSFRSRLSQAEFLSNGSSGFLHHNEAALNSIAQESNLQMALEDLWQLVYQWNQQGQVRASLVMGELCLEALRESSSISPRYYQGLQARFEEEVNFARGEGSTARQAEGYFHNFLDQVTDPLLLGSFAAGTVGYNLGRGLALRWLTRSPGVLSQGLSRGGRLSAFLTGVTAESAGFTLAHRGLHALAGHGGPPVSHAFGDDFRANLLSFTLFRSAGAGSQRILRWHQGVPAYLPAGTLRKGRLPDRLLQAVLPNTSLYGAILLSHGLQINWGWMPAQPFERMALSSLGSLLHLKAAGHLYHQIQPRVFRRWSQRVEREAQWLSHGPRVLKQAFPRNMRSFRDFLTPPRLALQSVSNTQSLNQRFFRTPGFWHDSILLSQGTPNPEAEPPPGRVKKSQRVLARPALSAEVEQILDAAPWPILVLNQGGRIIKYNPALRALSLVPGEVLEGKHYSEVLKPISENSGHYRLKGGGNEGAIYQIEEASLSNQQYHVIYLKSHETSKIMTRSAMVAQQRLQALENMNLLLRGLLHDANNTLSALNYFFEFDFADLVEVYVEKIGINRETLELIETGEATREGLSRTAAQISIFQKLMHGSNQRNFKNFSITDAARSTVRQFEMEAKRRKISIQQQFSPNPLSINGHEQIVSTALDNILRNAAHVTPEGGRIVVATYQRNQFAVIRVQDFGPGISLEVLDQIFEPGFTTKNKGVGNGMGLFMVKTVVEDILSGQVEVESELGKGTAFKLVFPLNNPDTLMPPSGSPSH